MGLRAPFYIDMVVSLKEEQIDALASAYPPPRYYADPEQMRSSIQLGIMFNIIDSTVGRKVDLIPLTMKPGYGFAMAGRVRRTIDTSEGVSILAWFARPDDVVVGKLMAWQEGGSSKHESDIRDILIAVHLGDDPEITAMFDFAYVDDWAKSLGENVERFWQAMKEIARPDAD
jgi:hypothetical protein